MSGWVVTSHHRSNNGRAFRGAYTRSLTRTPLVEHEGFHHDEVGVVAGLIQTICGRPSFLQISRTISSVSRSLSLGKRSRRHMRRVTLSSLLASDGVGTLSTGPQENPKGADWSAAGLCVSACTPATNYRIGTLSFSRLCPPMLSARVGLPWSRDGISEAVAKIAKPTGSKLVKRSGGIGEICSVEVDEK